MPALAASLFSGAWAQGPEQRATEMIDRLEADEFAAVADRFDPQMAALMDADGLAQVWTSLVQQVGPLQSRGMPVAGSQGAHQVVVTPLRFEQATFDAFIAFDADARLAGLHLQPAATAPSE